MRFRDLVPLNAICANSSSAEMGTRGVASSALLSSSVRMGAGMSTCLYCGALL